MSGESIYLPHVYIKSNKESNEVLTVLNEASIEYKIVKCASHLPVRIHFLGFDFLGLRGAREFVAEYQENTCSYEQNWIEQEAEITKQEVRKWPDWMRRDIPPEHYEG